MADAKEDLVASMKDLIADSLKENHKRVEETMREIHEKFEKIEQDVADLNVYLKSFEERGRKDEKDIMREQISFLESRIDFLTQSSSPMNSLAPRRFMIPNQNGLVGQLNDDLEEAPRFFD